MSKDFYLSEPDRTLPLIFPTLDLLSNYLTWRRILPRVSVNGGLMVDVGACVGGFSLAYRDIYTSPIHALEPWPDCWTYLEHNLCNSNVTIHKLGAFNRHVQMSMFVNTIGHTSLTHIEAESREVDLVPLDDLITDSVDVLKIDAEGSERRVLEGARRILDKDKPDLIVEHLLAKEDNFDHQKDSLFVMIDSYGYGRGKHIVGNDYYFRNPARYNE